MGVKFIFASRLRLHRTPQVELIFPARPGRYLSSLRTFRLLHRPERPQITLDNHYGFPIFIHSPFLLFLSTSWLLPLLLVFSLIFFLGLFLFFLGCERRRMARTISDVKQRKRRFWVLLVVHGVRICLLRDQFAGVCLFFVGAIFLGRVGARGAVRAGQNQVIAYYSYRLRFRLKHILLN